MGLSLDAPGTCASCGVRDQGSGKKIISRELTGCERATTENTEGTEEGKKHALGAELRLRKGLATDCEAAPKA